MSGNMKLKDLGFTEGINEIIAITQNEDGSWNSAPIGLIVEDPESTIAKAKLYRNRTRENLERTGILFANVTDDAITFALSALSDLDSSFFASLHPPVLRDAMAWAKFGVEMIDDFAVLKLIDGEVVERRVRAVNRGFNAVIEALVHATRYVIAEDEKSRRELLDRILYYKGIAEKCGSLKEKRAFEIIMEKIKPS